MFLSTDDTTGDGHTWAKESAEIDETLRREGKGDQFSLISRPGIDSKRLYTLMLDEKPDVLHIISEVSEGQLVLPNTRGEKIVQQPEALAKLFRNFRAKLKWVVLSGCFSEPQAIAISNAIPQGVVIGFDCEMPAKYRISAAVGMYFAMKSDQNQPAEVLDLTRSYVRLEGGNPDHVYLFQAGKEIQPDSGKESGPDSALPQGPRPTFSERVGTKVAFHCDRVIQRQEFLWPYENNQQDFNFFAVHGAQPQAHHGLVESFYDEYLYDEDWPEESKKFQVVLDEADVEDKYQTEIRSKLLKEMRMGKLLRLDDDLEMTEAARRFAKKDVDTVAVEFRVKSSHWKPFTAKLIHWFTSEYCQIRSDDFKPPQFYFFLSIIYEQEVDHLTSLREIRELVAQFPNCTVLTELDQVEKKDIIAWIERHVTPDSLRQEKIWRTYFFDQLSRYDMEEVQRRLDTIINIEPSDYE